jgi:hypothetical protein
VLLLAVGCGGPKPHPIVVGAVEDAAKTGDPAAAMSLARRAGFRAIALSAVWTPPATTIDEAQLGGLRAAVQAAAADGIKPIVAVYSFSGVTPLTDEARGQFASFAASIPRSIPDVRDVVVGNEPNLNLFWMPQFAADGSDAAAPAYLALLARTYDALKAVDPAINVIGGALASRGSDDPEGKRPTHSPTRFIEDLGAAYRASGRSEPVMDMFSLHPLPGELRDPADVPAPEDDVDRHRRLRQADQAPRGRARQGAPHRLRRVRDRDRDPTGARRRLQRPRAGRGGRRGDAGTGLRRRDATGGMPAARAHAPLLPRHRRAAARGVAERRLLRRRPAETEPPRGGGRRPRRCRGQARVSVVSGQYVAYTYFRVLPEWRRLPVEERAAAKDAFAEVVEDWTPRFEALHSYTTTGVRPETDFFLWKITQRYEDLGELGAALNATPLAGYLETPYSYLATTKASSTRVPGAPGRSRRASRRTSSSTPS